MKSLFFLLTMACVASLPAADEPKSSPQRSVDEINREIENLKARMDALDQEKKLLQKKAEEFSKFSTPIRVKEHPDGKYGYFIIDPKNPDAFAKVLEMNGTEYMNPRMGMEMAERISAERIKAHVRKADAEAKRILEGHPPSPVHGN